MICPLAQEAAIAMLENIAAGNVAAIDPDTPGSVSVPIGEDAYQVICGPTGRIVVEEEIRF
jgi:hypothetical protein